MSGVWRLDPEVEPGVVGVDPAGLDKMVALFNEGIERGEVCHGAQMAMHRGGKRVLDVGGGRARVRSGVPVRPDTMFVVFSATKGLAALAMWRLYERRAFHFDEPLKRYWPEIDRAIPEKSQVTIRHVMSHRGGFPQPPEWLTARYWSDRDALVRGMEEAPLVWQPGEKNGYHPMNFGHVLNEFMQRVDGRDCGRLLREEVFAPLGLRDIYVGLDDAPGLEERVAWVSAREVQSAAEAAGVAGGSAASEAAPPPSAAAQPAVPERYRDTPELAHPMNRPEVHRAVLPAGGGIATARDLSAVYSVLALGGKRGDLQLIRADSLDHAATPTNRSGDIDRTLRMPIRWGTGWHLGNYGKGSSLRSFGHGGAGGQVGFADREHALAFAFATTGQRHPSYLAWRTELQNLAFAACKS